MIGNEAKSLIEQYINGWKANDVNLICRSLAENCTIIESHGPIYRGLPEVREWVAAWIKVGYKVDKWELLSFLFTDDTSVFEWSFAFSSSTSSAQSIYGVSIVKFEDNKIVYLREYRSTGKLYDWKINKELNPH